VIRVAARRKPSTGLKLEIFGTEIHFSGRGEEKTQHGIETMSVSLATTATTRVAARRKPSTGLKLQVVAFAFFLRTSRRGENPARD